MNRPVINQRYESKAQVERFKKAAKLKKWSLNTFMLHAGEVVAAQFLATEKQATQLIVESTNQPLNQ